jgi:hypothetical protein
MCGEGQRDILNVTLLFGVLHVLKFTGTWLLLQAWKLMWRLYLVFQIVFLTGYKIGRSLKSCVLAVLIFKSLTIFCT